MKMTDAMAGLAFAGILTFSLSLVGCGSQPAPAPQTTAAPAQEQPAQTQTQEQAAPAQTQTQEQAAPAQTAPQQTNNNLQAQIDEAQAKQVAFGAAGVAEQDATLTKCNLDYDDGVLKYEIEFRVGMTEYDYDVDANTGAILSYSVEVDD